MFRFLDQLTPGDVEAITAFVQMEMLEAGLLLLFAVSSLGGTDFDNLGRRLVVFQQLLVSGLDWRRCAILLLLCGLAAVALGLFLVSVAANLVLNDALIVDVLHLRK